ncbi:nacrein-like protein M [Papaver somniferum]|uniref:nacrein-like protein M n=1 Tax=Papaver somniferum TaxID=3469 RepID=UPI000E6F88EA|nr:nacrein-like protein M [Papaver somniferum]
MIEDTHFFNGNGGGGGGNGGFGRGDGGGGDDDDNDDEKEEDGNNGGGGEEQEERDEGNDGNGDHKKAVRLFRRQSSYVKMNMWPLEGECARVKEIVENSGLYNVVLNSVVAYDKVAISSLYERYYGEVDTFKFPFGEMALTPNNADHILGLQVEGKSTNDKFKKRLTWKEIYALTKNLFGWDEETTNGLSVKGNKYPKKENKLLEIRKMYAGSKIRDG